MGIFRNSCTDLLGGDSFLLQKASITDVCSHIQICLARCQIALTRTIQVAERKMKTRRAVRVVLQTRVGNQVQRDDLFLERRWRRHKLLLLWHRCRRRLNRRLLNLRRLDLSVGALPAVEDPLRAQRIFRPRYFCPKSKSHLALRSLLDKVQRSSKATTQTPATNLLDPVILMGALGLLARKCSVFLWTSHPAQPTQTSGRQVQKE
mmetsp:Transcript_11503/g.32101  ORF Transcript_11503/g.32101 Transcript_11503/m.32101 type:complete len:206 (+) Transcript_11503:411-1028(+)